MLGEVTGGFWDSNDLGIIRDLGAEGIARMMREEGGNFPFCEQNEGSPVIDSGVSGEVDYFRGHVSDTFL